MDAFPEGSPPRTLELPEALDLTAAAPLAEDLIKRLGEPLTIDASRVQRLGASCFQVLLSAQRTWKTNGLALTLMGCSERFAEDSRLLGVEPSLFSTGDSAQ